MHIPKSPLKELLIDAELGIPVQVGPSRELLCRARLHGAQVLDTPVAVEGEGERGRACPTAWPRRARFAQGLGRVPKVHGKGVPRDGVEAFAD